MRRDTLVQVMLWISFLLALAGLAMASLIIQHQMFENHGLYEMSHWAPVRSESSNVVWPLENSRGGESYWVLIALSDDNDIDISGLKFGLRIHGEDAQQRQYELFVGDVSEIEGGRKARFSVTVSDNLVEYIVVSISDDLKGAISVVGVTASGSDIKWNSVNTQIGRDSSRRLIVLLVLLVVMLLGALVLCYRSAPKAG